MNALEFFADVNKQTGIVDSGEEITILLPGEDIERPYFHMSAEGDHYIYEYLTITSRGRKYDRFYSELRWRLDEMPVEKQYTFLRKMELVEIDFEPEASYDEVNAWYLYDSTCMKYPLYSVRGTCNREKECNEETLCCKVHDEPCCFNKKVGCSDSSKIKYPEYFEFLPEFVIWMTVCPDMDVLYVMHDFFPVHGLETERELNFEFAFLLKDHKITYISDKQEVKRLYEEYHEKYPCDTSRVEDMMNSWYDDVPDFHF